VCSSDLAARPGRNPAAPLRVAVLLTPLAEPQPREMRLLRAHFATGGVDVVVEDAGLATREAACDPAVTARLAAADLVLISGGASQRVYDATVGTPALAALEEARAAGAVVAGCSAGAVVMGRGHLRERGEERQVGDRWGWLGQVIVVPHYGRRDVSHTLRSFPGCSLLGIPNGAMALVEPDTGRIESLGPAPLWIVPEVAARPIELPAGQFLVSPELMVKWPP
jgi:cyanophycinase